jgi:hypothetical protein
MNEIDGRPHPPAPREHVIRLAQEIRLHLGHGGANFPGAEELYKAAEKIEEWQRVCAGFC